MTTLLKVVTSLGFEDEKEFHSLVAGTDTATPESLRAFKKWQYEDGTKEGLLRLNRSLPNQMKELSIEEFTDRVLQLMRQIKATEGGIPGLDTPRKWVLTDGDEVDQTAYLYDWEAADANKEAKKVIDTNWRWVLAI